MFSDETLLMVRLLAAHVCVGACREMSNNSEALARDSPFLIGSQYN